MEETTEVIDLGPISDALADVVNNQEMIIQHLVEVNTKLQYQANQFHVLLVGLTLVFVTYFLYGVLKKFC